MAALAKLEQSSRAHSRECVPTTVSAAYSKWRHDSGGGSGTARRHSVRAELAMAIVTAAVVVAATTATNHPQSILVYGSNRRLASFLSRLRCS